MIAFRSRTGLHQKATLARPQMPAMQMAMDMVQVEISKYEGVGGVWELTHKFQATDSCLNSMLFSLAASYGRTLVTN